jgi:hypothetical protein
MFLGAALFLGAESLSVAPPMSRRVRTSRAA